MSALTWITNGLRKILQRREETMNTNENTARHDRIKPPESMKSYIDRSGTERCGDPECGGEVIDQNGRGNRVCMDCGKKAT